jgi:hypothetical protein
LRAADGDKFKAGVQLAAEYRRKHEQSLRFLAKYSADYPEYAFRRVYQLTLEQRRLWRRFLRRRFGAQFVNDGGFDHVVDFRRPPQTLGEWWLRHGAMQEFGRWELSFRGMSNAGVKVLDSPEATHWTEDERRSRVCMRR